MRHVSNSKRNMRPITESSPHWFVENSRAPAKNWNIWTLTVPTMADNIIHGIYWTAG